MAVSLDPIALAQELINCPSVTPARGEVFDVLERVLKPLGFTVHRWVLGEPPDGPTENMVAIRGSGSPHFGFAGHLDVVPPGEGWNGDPFNGHIEDGVLVGRDRGSWPGRREAPAQPLEQRLLQVQVVGGVVGGARRTARIA